MAGSVRCLLYSSLLHSADISNLQDFLLAKQHPAFNFLRGIVTRSASDAIWPSATSTDAAASCSSHPAAVQINRNVCHNSSRPQSEDMKTHNDFLSLVTATSLHRVHACSLTVLLNSL